MVEFKTIREVAKTGLVSEQFLRKMVKEGQCPHIKSGNRILVNVQALNEKLDAMSRQSKGVELDEQKRTD